MRFVCHLVTEICQECAKSVFVRKPAAMTIILVETMYKKSHTGSLTCLHYCRSISQHDTWI